METKHFTTIVQTAVMLAVQRHIAAVRVAEAPVNSIAAETIATDVYWLKTITTLE
jgi:hypothetical protein